MKKTKQKAFFFFTLFLLGYTTYIGLKNVFRYNKFKAEYATVQLAYEDQVRLNKTYKRQLASMQTTDYWELQAKKQLGYVNHGEQVVKIIAEESK